MIEVFEGRLGGGKSYSAVLRAVDHFRRGGTLVTNVAIHFDVVCRYVRRYWAVELEADQFRVLEGTQVLEMEHHIPCGTRELPVLAIIDEAHIWLGVRETSDKAKKALADWLTQTRKLSIDLIFITQNASNIDVRVVRLIQYVWRFRDLEKWVIPGIGKFTSLCRFFTLGLLSGRYIIQSCFDYDGKTLCSTRWITKNPAIFALYDTDAVLYDLRRAAEVAKPRELKRTQRKGMSKMVKIVVVLGIVGLVFAAWKGCSGYRSLTAKHQAAGAASGVASVAAPPAVTSGGTPARRQAAYQLAIEEFRGGSRGLLRTDGGEYRPGELSWHGMCESVRDNVARFRTPEGDLLYVVAAPRGAKGKAPAASQ